MFVTGRVLPGALKVLHEKRWTSSFQTCTKPKKSLAAIVIPALHSPGFLRPFFKILLAGDRNCNIHISNHFCPQVWTLPDAERSSEQDVVVAAFPKRQGCMERWTLPIVLPVLRRSAAIAVFKLGESERPPEGPVIPLRLILHVLARGEMIGHQHLLLHKMEDALALQSGHVPVQLLCAFQTGCLP